jgi:hypothetical protein
MQLDTAKANATSKLDAIAAAQDAAKALEAKRADAAKTARDAKLALVPISVFISRKTQRLYVRHRFELILDVPVMIRDPDKAIGMHVLTAVARGDGGLRWTAVTIEGETAPRPRSTASPSRKMCLIASRRPHCPDPRSSSRMSR